MAATIKRKFVPMRLLIGIGLVLGGLLGIYVQLFTDVFVNDAGTHRISIGLLLACGVLPLAGLGTMAAAFFGRACSACNVELEEGSISYPAPYYPQLRQAIERAGAGDFAPLTQFQTVPPGSGEGIATLEYAVCPRCAGVGEVSAATKAFSSSSNDYDVRELSPAVRLNGPAVAQVLALRRN
jgi:hypothetical protein